MNSTFAITNVICVQCSECGAGLNVSYDRMGVAVIDPCKMCLEKKAWKLNELCNIIEAHEIESLSCDGNGEKHCECLREKVAQIRKAQKAHGGWE